MDRFGVNDHRYRYFEGNDGPVPFICECDDPACLREVRLTPADYLKLRAAGQPALAPEHGSARGVD